MVHTTDIDTHSAPRARRPRRTITALGLTAAAALIGTFFMAQPAQAEQDPDPDTTQAPAPDATQDKPDQSGQAPTMVRNAGEPDGIDVSRWQGGIHWVNVRKAGVEFAYIKATEGHDYKDPQFNNNYPNAYYAGVIRGAYHFARPDRSSGATQANWFVNNGGAWSRDNLTLPGALDIEANPAGAACYNMSATQLRNWITSFATTYKSRTGRDPVIYTSPSWWNTCTASWTGAAQRHPLWVAHWTTGSPRLPSGWAYETMWQYSSTGRVNGIVGNVDLDIFNGQPSRLLALANNTP